MGETQVLTKALVFGKKARGLPLREIEKRLAQKVREDSKTVQKPTSDFTDIELGLDREAIRAVLDGMAIKDKFSDIKPVRAATKNDYFFCNLYLTGDQAERLALIEDFKTDLVERVRDQSRQGQPVRISSIGTVGSGLATGEIEAGLTEILDNPSSADIKQLVAFSGAAFLYSQSSLSPEQASNVARHDELRIKAQTRIREDSQYSSKLTATSSLRALSADLRPGEIEGILEEIKQASTDIISISGRKGEEYLFSNRHMSDNYARMLGRVEANDPCYTIIETVREESQIYPRPTNIELFKYGIFNIDRDKLDEYVKRVLDENDDINGYRSSTGNVYLYSTTFLPDAQAALIVERKEHPE